MCISDRVSPARLLALGAGNGIDSLGDLGVVIDSTVVIAALFIVGQAGVHIRGQAGAVPGFALVIQQNAFLLYTSRCV